MRLILLLRLLLLFNLSISVPLPLPMGNSVKNKEQTAISEAQVQVLLHRLDHAKGDEHQLSFFRMLLLSQKPVDSCKEKENCIQSIVEAVEKIVLQYTIHSKNANSTQILQEAKRYTDQLLDVEKNYYTRLSSLPEPLKFWYGFSMSQSISNFLSYELKILKKCELELVITGKFDEVWHKVGNVSAHCFAAVQSGVKTFQILGFNFDAGEKTTAKLASWFHFNSGSEHVKKFFKSTLNMGKRDESSPRDITADMNYLRDALSITLKGGMFLLLCIQFQVYVCSIGFGIMVSISCFIWISVYLEMISTTV